MRSTKRKVLTFVNFPKLTMALIHNNLQVKGFENTCYALHLEFQPKVKTANEIFNLIISR